MLKDKLKFLPAAVPVVASLVAAAFVQSPSGTAEETYSFGGSCPSQGAWTQTALAQTKNISSILQKLKDNPDCKGIESVVQDLGAAVDVLKIPEDKAAEAATIESLPGEIDALRKVIASGGLTANLQNILFKKAMTAAEIGGKAASESAVPLDATSAIRALYTRTKRATEYGIAATERVFKVLPSFDKCLVGQPDQGMALVSAAVKVGASFAASGEGVGSRLGSAIASLVTMVRDRKFTLAMRQNHETEFWLSVSCLLETSTKNFCEAQNAQELLQYSQNEYLRSRQKQELGKVDPNYDNPLEGYYLLVRELPTIAQWLRAVKLGTRPKLSSDANFQVNAIERVTEMWKMDKTLRAQFAQEIEVMKGLKDVKARRNKIFQILSDMVDAMGGGDSMDGPRGAAKEATEFFTNSVNTLYMPFYLIGLDEIPGPCRASDENINPKRWDQWMQSSGSKETDGYVVQFENPDQLARMIESRLNVLIEGANEKAGVFFRQRIVIDLLNLVNKTLVGQNMTVRQALKHVDRYLERFSGRLTASYDDNVMRGSVRDVRFRIQSVLTAYDGLALYGQLIKDGKPLADADGNPPVGADGAPLTEQQAMQLAAQQVIDAVFNQLNILYQSDVYLTNNLTTFIERDFAIAIAKADGRITQDQRQLLKIAQDHMLEKIVEVHGVNPTSARNDLMLAQVVNVRNLNSLEQIFSDTMFLVLEELNEIAHGRPADASSMRKLMRKRFEKERSARRRAALAFRIPGVMPFGDWWGWLRAGHDTKKGHPDLYSRPYDPARVSSADTMFKDFAGFRAQLCAQTLAFEGRTRFIDFCKGAVLKSFFASPKELSELDLAYDAYLPNAQFDKQLRADPAKVSKARCALNDYNIRNWVRLLEDRDRRSDGEE